MNRIFAGLFALAVLTQGTFAATELTRVQANRIGALVGAILERNHFRQAKLNDEISAMTLTNYLNALDPMHMFFLQSDVDSFRAKYQTRLDDAIRAGDVGPAFQIFEVYKERLAERSILTEKLLKQEYDFTEDESFIASRSKEPWPADDAEAAKLWRLRIKYELLQGRLSKEKPEDTVGLISRRYARLEKERKGWDTSEVLQVFLSSLAEAYDPHSNYMSPREVANFDIQVMNLSLSGIGAVLIAEDGHTKIRELMAGGPAARSKQIRPGDKIVAVAQGEGEPVDVVEMPLNKVVELIRGKKGTEVRLTIIPAKNPDTKRVVAIVRDEVKLKDQFAKARVYDFDAESGEKQRIGVISLSGFYDNCAEHVEQLIERLKKEGMQSLILDLRRNGGGLLDQAVELTGLFIKKGPVVQVKEPRREALVLEDRKGSVAWTGPLIVAVDKTSASASEILAAALQDHGRAVIVGDQSTFGKGTVQQVLALESYLQDPRSVPQPGKIKLTVSKFYRIAGGTTQKNGVTPDIVWPSILDYLDIGEASLENCLPANQISPAAYNAQDYVKPYLAELQARSKSRVASSQDFAYMLEDIERIKKRKEEKAISLNEAARIAEREEEKARQEARKKERANREKLAAQVYELNLDMLADDLPLKPFTGEKAEEDLELVEIEKPDAEEEEEDTDPSPLADPHLAEALNIMRDYMTLMQKENKPAVVQKN